MQAFPPALGRITQKSAETVHFRKISSQGRKSNGTFRTFTLMKQFLEQNYAKQIHRKDYFFDRRLLMVLFFIL